MKDLETLLELLRVQRHDFANHLQVISGLMQLKKYDRVRDFVKQVGEELGKAGAIARIENPELVKNILIAEAKARKKGITFECNILTNMEGFDDSDHELASVIEQILDYAVAYNDDERRCIMLGVDAEKGQYIFDIHFSVTEPVKELTDRMNPTVNEKKWFLNISENESFVKLILRVS